MANRSRLAWLGWASAAALTFLVGCEGPAGSSGLPGPQGPSGTPGQDGADGTDNPSVSAITPGMAFLERRIDVVISGYGTEWTAAATADFGAGISVDGTTLASPTALVATITIDATAALGPRDVTVTDGDSSVTYAGAFNVQAPLFVPGYLGSLSQGSIVYSRIEQRDVTTPFDTLSGVTFWAGENSPGLLLDGALDPYRFEGLVFFDVNATTGLTEVVAESGLPGGEIPSREPDVFDVQPRTPTVITPGTTGAQTVANGFDTLLFSFTAAPNTIVTVSASATSVDATPLFMLLPASGLFADRIGGDFLNTISFHSGGLGGDFYVPYWDPSGESGYDGEVTIDEVPSDDLEPNNDCMMAQPITAPASLANLELAGPTDEDWFAIDIGASEVGGQIHVVTLPGDPTTDTWVDILAPDCTTSLGGPSSDIDYHEDFTSDPIPAAGTYYVKVYHSSFPFSGRLYDVGIDLILPDPNEPNDTSGTATPVPGSTTLDAQIAPEFDQDWYAVTLAANAILIAQVGDGQVDLCGPAGPIDSEIEIYDTDGTTSLAFNDDIGFGNYCSGTSITAGAAGTYYIRVGASVQFCDNCTFDYSLSITILPPVGPDPAEPNDTSATATAAMSGVPITATIAPGFDNDYFSITAGAGQTITAAVGDGPNYSCAPNLGIDSEIEIFDTDGTTSLATNDDIDVETSWCSEATTTAGAAGTYYVRVAASQAFCSACTFDYTVTIDVQ